MCVLRVKVKKNDKNNMIINKKSLVSTKKS